MDFSKLTLAEAIQFLVVNGYTNIPENQAHVASVQLFTYGVHTNFQNVKLTMPLVAMDRAVRFSNDKLQSNYREVAWLPQYFTDMSIEQYSSIYLERMALHLYIDKNQYDLRAIFKRILEFQGKRLTVYFRQDRHLMHFKYYTNLIEEENKKELDDLFALETDPNLYRGGKNFFDSACRNFVYYAHTPDKDGFEMLSYLLEKGVDPNLHSTGDVNGSLLDLISMTGLSDTKRARFNQVYKILIERYRLNPFYDGTRNHLFAAVRGYNYPIIEYLLSLGLNVYGYDEATYLPAERKENILSQAMFDKDVKMITYLIQKGFNPDVLDPSGKLRQEIMNIS